MKSYIHKVQYYETDKMGVVHHSNYIRWFEEARIDFLDQIGLSFEKLEQKGFFSPVLSVICDYKKPAAFGDSVIVEVFPTKWERVRFEFTYYIYDKATQEIRVSGKTTHCFINSTGKIISLEKEDPESCAVLRQYLQVE